MKETNGNGTHQLDDNNIDQLIDELCTNYSELHVKTVDKLNYTPTALQFYRDYVSANIPVILTKLTGTWLVNNWSTTYLSTLIGSTTISVSITPNGLADAIISCTANNIKYFVEPYTVSIQYNEFIDLLHNTDNAHKSQYYIKDAVYYAQQQNNCFTTEYNELHKDIHESTMTAAAFDTPPDAVNIWIGCENSISSLHRDMYENIYTVICGSKTFYLYPPVTYKYFQFKHYPTAKFIPKRFVTSDIQYVELTDERYSEWCIVPNNAQHSIPWTEFDATTYDSTIHSKHLQPTVVTLQAGDTIYLPAMWYHQVHQSNDTIAINYWYDMKYDIKYCYNEFVRTVVDKHTSKQ